MTMSSEYLKMPRKKIIAQLKAQLFYERLKPRELIAWVLVAFGVILKFRQQIITRAQFCYPRHHEMMSSSSTTISKRSWHGGSPISWETGDIPTGSCWCGDGDGYCLCTPNLSTDIVLRDPNDPSKIYLVKRKDTGQHATIGGFVNVGEKVEDAMIRELREETGINLDYHSSESHFHLLGVYSDPRRDKRRSNVSVSYVAIVPKGSKPHAGDDAKSIELVSIKDVPSFNMFADHKYILGDYAKSYGLIDDADELAAASASTSESLSFRSKVRERTFHRTTCQTMKLFSPSRS